MADGIEVREGGMAIAFSFNDMLRYSGPDSPGGVALGFKVLEHAFAVLEPGAAVERRDVVIRTAFAGPGARDACELVTRGLTDGRYIVDPALARPERGLSAAFVFQVTYHDGTLSLLLRDGFVTDEFATLARAPDLTAHEQRRFADLKQALADRLMATDAVDVFDVE